MKLSAIIITKNEEKMVKGCIQSLDFVDEIIVVDSNSLDKTAIIAKNHGARVINHTFKNYADQRMFAAGKAQGEWILYIDADERVSIRLKEEIITALHSRQKSDVNAYKIPRQNYYLGNHKWPHIEYLERLFLKKALKCWEGNVHEHAIYIGKSGKMEFPIIHYTHRSLSQMLIKTNKWGDIEAKMLFDSHHPKMNILRFIKVMVNKFFDSYIRQGGWKIGTVGLIESMYQAYSYFIIYTKLWEMQIKSRKST